MKVLVACEYSGTVRDAFRARGHDAWSCDILPTDADPAWHIQGDAIEVAYGQDWDLMIAHPPCTYLTNSGVRWFYTDPTRWGKLDQAAQFFRRLFNAPIVKIAVENPIMHKYAKERIDGMEQSQVIQPWMFGHTEQKATCLWLKGLPLIRPTNNVKEQMMALPNNERQRIFPMSPGPDRWKLRSTTFKGIAEAMAEQWGVL